MRPPDAITGWDDAENAELYEAFSRDFPLYEQTSRDLTKRADLDPDGTVLDLCGGTGIAAAVALEAMSARGRVISVDGSQAMQSVGRRARPDPRIAWVNARAEDVAARITGQVDAVLCNAAIWKTDTPTTFAAVKQLLHPGKRFVFNVGGGFAGLAHDAPTRAKNAPSLTDLIHVIATRDYGYVPPHQTGSMPGPILTEDVLRGQLQDNGFTVISTEVTAHHATMEEKKAWLSIPLFSRPPGRLNHQKRMEILEKAYQEIDKNRGTTTRWLTVVARA
jgi:SAM-dependent methyltransferase